MAVPGKTKADALASAFSSFSGSPCAPSGGLVLRSGASLPSS